MPNKTFCVAQRDPPSPCDKINAWLFLEFTEHVFNLRLQICSVLPLQNAHNELEGGEDEKSSPEYFTAIIILLCCAVRW